MRLTIRKELILGAISIIVFSILLVFYIRGYESFNASSSPSISTNSVDPNTILSSVEISKHNNINDCWIIIENKVYVVSNFLSRHPGGGGLITPYCGKDATQPFLTKDGRGNHSAAAFRLLGFIYIGDINSKVSNQPDLNSITSIPVGENEENDD